MNFEIGLGLIVLTIIGYTYLVFYKDRSGWGAIILLPCAFIGTGFGLLIMALGYWAFVLVGAILLICKVIGKVPSVCGISLADGSGLVGVILLCVGTLWGWMA